MNDFERGIDLSPLDPELDPERLERMVRRVLDRLGPGLVEAPPPVVTQVAQLYARRFRPLVAVASIVAVAASVLLARRSHPPADDPIELAQVPAAWVTWATGEAPSPGAFLFSLVEREP